MGREAEVAEKPAKKKEKEKTSEGPFENEINQLVREICVIEDKSAKLLEKKLKLEEQLQQVRFEEEQEQQKLFTKRKSLRAAVCNAREIENTQRLDKLPQEVWEKILDNLKSDDLFPLALSCRYFRQKQKELVERGSQHGPESDEVRLALKTNLKRKLDEAEYQPASADYLRFCSKEKVPRRSVPRRSSSVHFMGHKEIVWRLAAFHGHLPLLQELLKRLFMLDRDFIKYAARGGQVETLQWLHQQGADLSPDLFRIAGAGGHLETLKWLRSEGCPWNAGACNGAARGGHLEILKWLRSKGCPWNERTCLCAAVHGHLDVLRWAIDNGCPYEVNQRTRPALEELGLI